VEVLVVEELPDHSDKEVMETLHMVVAVAVDTTAVEELLMVVVVVDPLG
jgi:radical SAM superfamily enzyme